MQSVTNCSLSAVLHLHYAKNPGEFDVPTPKLTRVVSAESDCHLLLRWILHTLVWPAGKTKKLLWKQDRCKCLVYALEANAGLHLAVFALSNWGINTQQLVLGLGIVLVLVVSLTQWVNLLYLQFSFSNGLALERHSCLLWSSSGLDFPWTWSWTQLSLMDFSCALNSHLFLS